MTALAACGLGFGTQCLNAEKRLENKVCQGVVSDGAAIALVVFGGLATIPLWGLFCWAYHFKAEDSQETSSRAEDPPTHAVVGQIYVIRHVAIEKIGVRNTNNV
ncbi:uncharacterized protein LOC106152932 [Lingula anatina]|uniref:Uncharacterized protein LOC106152932 n=1 Tax=Lingula anatina TaxID=7574 RepID=A0A1S3H7N7_LINAN|nr:uncharacterized protein LOC106152932 [Lingula anatina]|eukprot:XP_013382130.1 uncharacterized protein LOC106152932 [Lingula anatina]